MLGGKEDNVPAHCDDREQRNEVLDAWMSIVDKRMAFIGSEVIFPLLACLQHAFIYPLRKVHRPFLQKNDQHPSQMVQLTLIVPLSCACCASRASYA